MGSLESFSWLDVNDFDRFTKNLDCFSDCC